MDLDELLRLHDRMICARIDAGACQTHYDYARAERAETAFYAAKEAFEREHKASLDAAEGRAARRAQALVDAEYPETKRGAP